MKKKTPVTTRSYTCISLVAGINNGWLESEETEYLCIENREAATTITATKTQSQTKRMRTRQQWGNNKRRTKGSGSFFFSTKNKRWHQFIGIVRIISHHISIFISFKIRVVLKVYICPCPCVWDACACILVSAKTLAQFSEIETKNNAKKNLCI